MKTIKSVLTLSAVGLTAACGGGGGGANPLASIDAGGTGDPPAPTPVTVTTQGTITGFGSIIVNGVRYETSSANIRVDDQPGSESDLAVGQVVVIQGTLSDDRQSGVAENVIYDDLVEGPVSAIDLSANSMTVLGQTVIIDNDTVFDDDFSPQSLEGIAVNDVVEVSGYRRGDGAILATYVDEEDSPDDFETTGIVENVDTAAMTFEIGGLVVDYSSASLDGFPSGMPENGQLVEAEGDSIGASGELIATEVELEDDLLDIDVDEIEIEGLITRFESTTDFDVNGIPVTTNASTEYEDGSSADLALNRKVEVEGQFNAGGTIVAEEIEFEDEAEASIASLVEAVSDTQITLIGVAVRVDDDTEYEDESSLDLATFSIADIAVGDYIEARVYETEDGLVAARLERDDDPETTYLTGIAMDLDQPTFSVLGISVETTAETEFDDGSGSAAEFFSEAEGEEVEVGGTVVEGVLIAEEVDLDN